LPVLRHYKYKSKKGIDKKENMVYTLISGGLKWFKMDKDGLKCL